MSIRDEEKLRLFTDEALGSAEDTADRINKETNDEESRLLAEGEHKILTEAYEKIQSELKNIRRDNSRELSRETMIKRRELLLGLGIDHPILVVIDRRHICEHQLHIDPGNPPQQVIPLPMEVGTHSTLHPPRTAQTANARSHSIGRSPRVSSRPVPFINLIEFIKSAVPLTDNTVTTNFKSCAAVSCHKR